MDSRDNRFKFRLGLFVIFGLVVVTIIVFYIGRQKHLFDTTFILRTSFHNISGLQVGNHVRYSGINTGVIDNISIENDSTVIIYMVVDKKNQQFLRSDAICSIGSEGLMGERLINIGHGSGNASTVRENDMLPSTEPIETDELMASFQNTGQNAEIATDQLAEILLKINNGQGTLARLIRDTTIANNIDETIINLRSGSKSLNQNMEAAKNSFLFRGYFKKKKKEAQKNQNQDNK